MIEEIKTWILNFVSVHNETIGTVPCPFAKQAMAVDTVREGGIQRYF